MKPLSQMLLAGLLVLMSSGGFAHEISNNQTSDNDLMAQLDADVDAIRKTEDPVRRKEMLLSHLHMLTEHLQTIASMDNADANLQQMDEGNNETAAEKGPMGLGQSITNIDVDMLQHHQHMVKMMEHMIITQELILGLIDKN